MAVTTEKTAARCSCGSDKVFASAASNVMGLHSFWCRECGMESPIKKTRDAAIDAWNLMVAGPVLLEAAREAMDKINILLSLAGDEDPTWRKLYAAVEKATGEPPCKAD